MNSKHHLEKVEAKDLEQVVGLEQACFDDPWPYSAFVAELSHPWSYFKALLHEFCDDGIHMDGYLIAWMLLDEMHLLKMAVLPNRQRMGLARTMLSDCLKTFADSGGGVASLEVRPSNKAAIGLYTSFGFRQVAVRRAYYAKDNEDALLFIKDVAQSVPEYAQGIGR